MNQALGPIEEAYQRVGFPRFSIKTLVDQTKSQEKIQQLRSEKAKNDQELARRAMEAIKKQNQQHQKAAKPQNSVGPTQLGTQIKDTEPIRQMITIQEEERMVVVQGYIFDKEIRKFRSGRQLLFDKESLIIARQ